MNVEELIKKLKKMHAESEIRALITKDKCILRGEIPMKQHNEDEFDTMVKAYLEGD